MTPKSIFLSALRRRRTVRPAVGSATSVVTADLMEHLGIGFPQAHTEPEAMARLAAAGHTELGFDNVMPLFSVWHESAALGCEVDWGDSTRMPDGHPVCASIDEDVAIPADLLKRPGCAVPLEALRILARRLGAEAAVVGKVFGPWTLGYHVYGVQEFLMATLLKPERVHEVVGHLVEVTLAFAQAQIDAGADALTLADHCTRDLCSPQAYVDFLADMHRQLHRRIDCPLILHICGDTSDRLPAIAGTGIECFHFDSKVPAAEARRLAGKTMSLMGGTPNIEVIRNGTPQSIAEDIKQKLAADIDILGPECAAPLDAPYANLQRLTEAVKRVRWEED